MSARLWTTIAAMVIVLTIGFLYIGTTHRDRCMKDGNVGCTILPWSGHPGGNGGWGFQP